MFFQKRGNMALALAASGICLLSTGAMAQEASPYVGNSERARINEALMAEEALIKKVSAEPAMAGLTINPFPVNSPAAKQPSAPVATPAQKEIGPIAGQAEPSYQVDSAPAVAPAQVEEGFEVIELSVTDQPEEESAADVYQPQEDTFAISIEERPEAKIVKEVVPEAVEAKAETKEILVPEDPDLLVIPPSLYEQRVKAEQLPKPVKVKQAAVQPAPSQVAAAPLPEVAQPVQEIAPAPQPAIASYEPPPAVADNQWQPDSAPQSIVKEIDVVNVEPVQAVSPQAESGSLAETVNWIDPPPVKRWRALRGTALHDLLAMWSREGGMSFIWDSKRSFIVKETFSLQSSYEQALTAVLSQYQGDSFRPYGKVYLDADSGQRVVVIRSVD